MRLEIPSVSIEKRKGQFVTRAVPFGPNTRMHWSVRAKWNKEWKEMTAMIVRSATSFKSVTPQFRSVAFTLRMVQPYDKDNATASIKALLDGLVVAGVLEDDDAKHLEYLRVTPEKVLHRNQQGVSIDLW